MPDDLLDPSRNGQHGDGQPEYPRVGDEDDIAQRRSHERVQALLDEITNTRIRAANDVTNEVDEVDHRRAYAETVKELWTELRPTLANADDETERYYWHEISLGQFSVEPPEPLTEPAGRREAELRPSLQPGASWPTPERFDITGFELFNEMNVAVTVQFEARLDEDEITVPQLRQRIQRAEPNGRYRVWDRDTGDYREPFRVQKTKIVPKRIIDNARSALRELAEQSGQGFGKPDSIDTTEDDPV